MYRLSYISLIKSSHGSDVFKNTKYGVAFGYLVLIDYHELIEYQYLEDSYASNVRICRGYEQKGPFLQFEDQKGLST